MQDLAPAEFGGLLLRLPYQPEQGIAGVDVPAFRVTHPHAVVDGLADDAVQLLAGLERARV
jgi:hypothetical protein